MVKPDEYIKLINTREEQHNKRLRSILSVEWCTNFCSTWKSNQMRAESNTVLKVLSERCIYSSRYAVCSMSIRKQIQRTVKGCDVCGKSIEIQVINNYATWAVEESKWLKFNKNYIYMVIYRILVFYKCEWEWRSVSMKIMYLRWQPVQRLSRASGERASERSCSTAFCRSKAAPFTFLTHLGSCACNALSSGRRESVSLQTYKQS